MAGPRSIGRKEWMPAANLLPKVHYRHLISVAVLISYTIEFAISGSGLDLAAYSLHKVMVSYGETSGASRPDCRKLCCKPMINYISRGEIVIPA